MLKKLLTIAFVIFSLTSIAQEEIKDEISITLEGDKISISIDDERATTYDLLIYKTYEEIMMNEYGLTKNPVTVDISGWAPAIYHIKIDYAHVTQFRHYEVLSD